MQKFVSNHYIERLHKRFLKVRIPLYLAAILCVLLSVLVWGLTSYSFKVVIGEAGVSGVGVRVCWDINCDNPVASLSWGRISIGPSRSEVSKNVTVYVKNEGIVPVVILLNTSDWSPPSVERYIRLSWDYDGHILGVNEVVKVMFALSVNPEIFFETPRIQNFGFDIVILTSST